MTPIALIVLACSAVAVATQPTAHTRNGTVQGYHSQQWDQDFFLGIPYAEPPIGNLRYRHPQPYNQRYESTFDATKYGNSCYQYGGKFKVSEDCLTINIVRPSGHSHEQLPVLLWIYGGGLTQGSSADQQYNLSGIVKTASDSGQPFLGVSINYRLGVWGFLNTAATLDEGSTNSGLMDQRLAMRWVQENIAAFGGDPSNVVLWGESAGAQSIALHMHSFDGRDDDLYHAAILESGSAVGASLNTLPFYNDAIISLVKSTGCWNDRAVKYGGSVSQDLTTSRQQLDCLRKISAETLFNSNYTVVWNPLVDGSFLTAYTSTLAAKGKFVKVPILTGANTDEGASFSTKGLNSTAEVFNNLLYWRNYALSPPTVRKLLELYPDDPESEPPYSQNPYGSRDYGNATFPAFGTQWRRSAAIGGDLVMIAGRRKTCEQYTRAGQPVYSYRFDTPPWNASEPVAVQHFDNVVFSFQNISGALGPSSEYAAYGRLSKAIGRAYASFARYHHPNGQGRKNVTGLPTWSRYSVTSPKNMVLNANGSWVENDTWRKAGIAFMNSIDRELLA